MTQPLTARQIRALTRRKHHLQLQLRDIQRTLHRKNTPRREPPPNTLLGSCKTCVKRAGTRPQFRHHPEWEAGKPYRPRPGAQRRWNLRSSRSS